MILLKPPLLLLILLTSAFADNEVAIPRCISRLVQEWNEIQSGSHVIGILKMAGGRKPGLIESMTNEIISDLPKSNPVAILPFYNATKDVVPAKFGFVVIISDIYDQMKIYQFLISNCLLRPFWEVSSKILFIPVDLVGFNPIKILINFAGVGHINTVTIFEQSIENTRQIIFATFNPYSNKISSSKDSKVNFTTIFPEKHKDMHKYKYKFYVTENLPRLYINNNNRFAGVDSLFIREMTRHQNAKASIKFEKNLINFVKKIDAVYQGRETDFVLNTNIEIYVFPKKRVLTFDRREFCILVPIDTQVVRQNLFKFLVTAFDNTTWTIMVVVLILCSIVWKLIRYFQFTRSPVTTADFYFAIYGLFVGQSLPLQNLSRQQTFLVQLLVFGCFILGTAYQSELISSLIEGKTVQRMETLKELENSNITILADPVIYRMFQTATLNQNLLNRMVLQENGRIFAEDLFSKNSAVIGNCEYFEYLMYSKGRSQNTSHYFYMMKERFYPTYHYYTLNYFSPLYDTLSYYTAAFFESGIRQHWGDIYPAYVDERRLEQPDEPAILNLDDLSIVLAVWGIGLTLSLLAFIAELILFRYHPEKICDSIWFLVKTIALCITRKFMQQFYALKNIISVAWTNFKKMWTRKNRVVPVRVV